MCYIFRVSFAFISADIWADLLFILINIESQLINTSTLTKPWNVEISDIQNSSKPTILTNDKKKWTKIYRFEKHSLFSNITLKL